MISNYLSLVEALRPASDELAAQVARFLAGGGQIEEAAPIGYKPKPITYSNQMPPALKPFVRRRVEATPLPPALKRYTPAGTRRACRAYSGTGSHAHANGGIGCLGPEPAHPLQLREGVRHRLQEANPGRANGAVRSEQVQARDAKYAERIRAFLELGITRRQCCGRLAIGNKAFERIIAAHGIDYPKRS